MASILFNSPIPYETISEGRRREQANGADMAKSMMDTYYRATAQRAQREQWAEEKPLREARIASLAARADNEKAEAQLRSLAAINEARKANGMAGLAAVQEEAALNGWDGNSRAKLYNFISRNPEFAGSKEVAAVESNFEKAELARINEEKWRTEEAVKLETKRMQIEADKAAAASGNGKPVAGTIIVDEQTGQRRFWTGSSFQLMPNLTPEQLAVFELKLKDIGEMSSAKKAVALAELMREYGVKPPRPIESTAPDGAETGQPAPVAPANGDWGGVGIFKFLRPPPTATP